MDLDVCPNLGLLAASAALVFPAVDPARDTRGRLVAADDTDSLLPLVTERTDFDVAAGKAESSRPEVGGEGPREDESLDEEAERRGSTGNLSRD